MKRTSPFLLVLALFIAPAAARAQFEYSTNDDGVSITITGYTGAGGAVAIPTNINSLTVTSLADYAFDHVTTLTSVTIPDSVTNIGEGAFYQCFNLSSVTIGGGVTNIGVDVFAGCILTNITIPESVTSIGEDAFFGCPLTRVTIPESVTSIENDAFGACGWLTNITIPGSITNIGGRAFFGCGVLVGVYFTGNAPFVGPYAFDDQEIVYYLPGTTGWSSPFAGVPAYQWNPRIGASGTNFGAQRNQFGFNITGTQYIPIAVEACTNLARPNWIRLTTLTLTHSPFSLTDPNWTNFPGRFYRISSP